MFGWNSRLSEANLKTFCESKTWEIGWVEKIGLKITACVKSSQESFAKLYFTKLSSETEGGSLNHAESSVV